MLDKALHLTAAQYRAARFTLDILSDLLEQGSPDDESALAITIAEVLEVVGKQLAGAAAKN
ncbi:MAG: hypothetical protein WC314_19965 [Vulcanimicrobiota bacterium]